MVKSSGTNLEVNWMKVIDKLQENKGNVRKTAKDLKIPEKRVHHVCYKVREARQKAQNTVNIINNYMGNKYLRKYIY